jgi:hypothetical protein
MTLRQVILRDISYACMQASPDRAYGARVQSTRRLEENRRNNYYYIGVRVRISRIASISNIDIFSAFVSSTTMKTPVQPETIATASGYQGTVRRLFAGSQGLSCW